MKRNLLIAAAMVIPAVAATLLLTPAAPAAVMAGRCIAAVCLVGLCYVILGFITKRSLQKPMNLWLRLAIANALAAVALAASL